LGFSKCRGNLISCELPQPTVDHSMTRNLVSRICNPTDEARHISSDPTQDEKRRFLITLSQDGENLIRVHFDLFTLQLSSNALIWNFHRVEGCFHKTFDVEREKVFHIS